MATRNDWIALGFQAVLTTHLAVLVIFPLSCRRLGLLPFWCRRFDFRRFGLSPFWPGTMVSVVSMRALERSIERVSFVCHPVTRYLHSQREYNHAIQWRSDFFTSDLSVAQITHYRQSVSELPSCNGALYIQGAICWTIIQPTLTEFTWYSILEYDGGAENAGEKCNASKTAVENTGVQNAGV